MEAWRRGPSAGQQTAEFALLIGLVAVAAISMQYAAQRALKAGLWHATTATLGDPGPQNLANCSLVSLESRSSERTLQQGQSDFRRVTTTNQVVAGNSVVHDENVRTIPDLE